MTADDAPFDPATRMPYDPDRFPKAPHAERTRVQAFNKQYMWHRFWGPEVRANYRYLEHGEWFTTKRGRVFVQAGGIVPVSPRVMDARLDGARSALEHSSLPANLDQMVSLRPLPKKRWVKGESSVATARYATIPLGPRKNRQQVTVPYGRLVYLLRHPSMSAAFPASYEPLDRLAGSYASPEVRMAVRLGEIDEIAETHERGGEIREAAIAEFNKQMALGKDPTIIEVVLPGEPESMVTLPQTSYNTWCPKNIRIELIEPLISYEKEYEEFEPWLTDRYSAHYPNDFEEELNYFNLEVKGWDQ